MSHRLHELQLTLRRYELAKTTKDCMTTANTTAFTSFFVYGVDCDSYRWKWFEQSENQFDTLYTVEYGIIVHAMVLFSSLQSVVTHRHWIRQTFWIQQSRYEIISTNILQVLCQILEWMIYFYISNNILRTRIIHSKTWWAVESSSKASLRHHEPTLRKSIAEFCLWTSHVWLNYEYWMKSAFS